MKQKETVCVGKLGRRKYMGIDVYLLTCLKTLKCQRKRLAFARFLYFSFTYRIVFSRKQITVAVIMMMMVQEELFEGKRDQIFILHLIFIRLEK